MATIKNKQITQLRLAIVIPASISSEYHHWRLILGVLWHAPGPGILLVSFSLIRHAYPWNAVHNAACRSEVVMERREKATSAHWALAVRLVSSSRTGQVPADGNEIHGVMRTCHITCHPSHAHSSG
jgi:hypothetical protein